MKNHVAYFNADNLAAEQRAIVAHSVSYGEICHRIFQAPVGAKEKCSYAQIFFRAIRRLTISQQDSHSASYGFNRPQIHQAPAGATEIWRTPSPIC